MTRFDLELIALTKTCSLSKSEFVHSKLRFLKDRIFLSANVQFFLLSVL